MTTKPDLSDATEVEISVTTIRDGTPEDVGDKLAEALDEAQAPVFQGDLPYNYLVIKIVP